MRFTQFCDAFNVPEDLHMPTPEWLLSIFITTRGTGLVSGSTLRMWLLGLQLLHIVNGVPWHGTSHLKREIQGSSSAVPASTSHPKWAPVTLTHLMALRDSLVLSNTFDATVFAMAMVAFWCECHPAEDCVDSIFNPLIHATPTVAQKTVPMFYCFGKTNLAQNEYIM